MERFWKGPCAPVLESAGSRTETDLLIQNCPEAHRPASLQWVGKRTKRSHQTTWKERTTSPNHLWHSHMGCGMHACAPSHTHLCKYLKRTHSLNLTEGSGSRRWWEESTWRQKCMYLIWRVLPKEKRGSRQYSGVKGGFPCGGTARDENTPESDAP